MKCYVGTLNNVKIGAVKEVLSSFGINTSDIIGIDVNSGVSKQPMNDEETIKGAYNRANNLPKDGMRIGLEAGVALVDNILYLTNYGVLIINEEVYYAGGARIPLPNEIKDLIIINHLELSDAMETYFHTHDIKHTNGAMGYFTNDLVTRQALFVHLVKLLYGQYLYHHQNK